MKMIYKPIVLLLTILISNYIYAQQGADNLRANTVTNANAKVHANSNSIFGTNNSLSSYKKDQPKKEEEKPEEEKKRNIKVKTKKK